MLKTWTAIYGASIADSLTHTTWRALTVDFNHLRRDERRLLRFAFLLFSLFASSEPVVSRCGHLYCWACLHKWCAIVHIRQHYVQSLTKLQSPSSTPSHCAAHCMP